MKVDQVDHKQEHVSFWFRSHSVQRRQKQSPIVTNWTSGLSAARYRTSVLFFVKFMHGNPHPQCAWKGWLLLICCHSDVLCWVPWLLLGLVSQEFLVQLIFPLKKHPHLRQPGSFRCDLEPHYSRKQKWLEKPLDGVASYTLTQTRHNKVKEKIMLSNAGMALLFLLECCHQ